MTSNNETYNKPTQWMSRLPLCPRGRYDRATHSPGIGLERQNNRFFGGHPVICALALPPHLPAAFTRPVLAGVRHTAPAERERQ